MTKRAFTKLFKETHPDWKNIQAGDLALDWDAFLHQMFSAAQITACQHNKWSCVPEDMRPKKNEFFRSLKGTSFFVQG